MLELGRPGSAGVPKGSFPVLSEGTVVTALRTDKKNKVMRVDADGREWVFTGVEPMSARWADDPAGVARLSAAERPVTRWRRAVHVDLEGLHLEERRVKGLIFEFVDDGGRVVATTGVRPGWWARHTLTADPALPLAHQVFLLYLFFRRHPIEGF